MPDRHQSWTTWIVFEELNPTERAFLQMQTHVDPRRNVSEQSGISVLLV